ncbi:UNVERIFIED_CONTAM: hypothetical protein Sangu_3162700 [Sesamum angustifolium]|uniref:Uncharacterized protein n=1 Tax=Sesamum angustifolium TaxID=2727405 RepID=A0AAW2JVF0_9LAMI
MIVSDENQVVTTSLRAVWSKSPDSELSTEGRESSRLQDDETSKEHGFTLGNAKSHLILALKAEVLLQKCSKLKKRSSRCAKRPVMVQMEVSKSKVGLHDVNEVSNALASSPANDHISGIYGLKSELTDITKYVNELSLDELCGRYDYSSIAKDKGKSVSNSNSNFLQSYRKACSILQDQKVHQTQKCAEINSSFIQQVSTGSMMTGSATDQIDFNRGESLTAELPSSDKVKESGDEIKLSKSVSDSPLYLPKDILERLTLPLPKDLDSLLSDAHKTTSSSKSCDPRLGKTLFQQTGLPSFPWSHSFSGHSKLGADSVKLSTSRTMCNARWFKVKSSSTPQKDPVSSVWDIESLTFDQNLVPKVNLTSGSPENQTASVERVLSSSGASSTSRVPEELEKCHVSTLIPSGFQCLQNTHEHSPTYAAAKMLCDMATSSLKENLCTRVKLLKKPPQMAKKAWKSKASEKPTKLFDTPKSTRRPHNPVKVGGVGSPLKKLRLSTDVKHACIGHTDSVKEKHCIGLPGCHPHHPLLQSYLGARVLV